MKQIVPLVALALKAKASFWDKLTPEQKQQHIATAKKFAKDNKALIATAGSRFTKK